MNKRTRQTKLKLELEMQRAKELSDQRRYEARQMLIRAMTISEVARKRLFATMQLG